MKVLVVGYGSIGKRHTRLLSPMVFEVAVVSQQTVSGYKRFDTLEQALEQFAPDAVVIANVTSAHADSLLVLKNADFMGKVLAEKPLYASAAQDNGPYPFSVHVGYLLRFHAVVRALSEAIGKRKVLSAHIYVGQHLDTWRAGRETKQTYSATRSGGGGVLRDLSHELDLVAHLFGPALEHHAIGGRVSDVTVDSDDAVAFVMRCRDCPVVSLQMNYLDHVPRREWIVNTADISFRADLIQKTLAINNDIEHIPCEADDAYRAMHQAWLSDDMTRLCTYEEGLALAKLIDSVSNSFPP